MAKARGVPTIVLAWPTQLQGLELDADNAARVTVEKPYTASDVQCAFNRLRLREFGRAADPARAESGGGAFVGSGSRSRHRGRQSREASKCWWLKTTRRCGRRAGAPQETGGEGHRTTRGPKTGLKRCESWRTVVSIWCSWTFACRKWTATRRRGSCGRSRPRRTGPASVVVVSANTFTQRPARQSGGRSRRVRSEAAEPGTRGEFNR